MSKKELVEVTIKVPKRIMRLLEAENYFGYTKDEFFVAAVKGHIGVAADNISYETTLRVNKKYGSEISTYTFP